MLSSPLFGNIKGVGMRAFLLMVRCLGPARAIYIELLAWLNNLKESRDLPCSRKRGGFETEEGEK